MDALTLAFGAIASISVGFFAIVTVLGAASWSRDRLITGRLTRYVVPYLQAPDASDLDARFEELVGRTPFGEALLRNLTQLGIGARPGRLLVYGVIAAGGVFVAVNIYTGSALFGGLAFAGTLVAAYVAVGWRAAKQFQRYRLQLPEALHVIASALSAGASLNQALKHAAHEIVPPLQAELRRVVEDVEVGKTLEEALDDLRTRVPISDFDMISASLLIQQRSGGNLAELLNETAHILKQSQQLRQEMEVLTSQARLSAQLIGLLPVGLFAYMYVANRSYLDPLLDTGLGHIVLGVGATLEVVGYFVVMRIATYNEYQE